MSEDRQRQGLGGDSDLLDDELPPEIPDISDPMSEAHVAAGEVGIPIEVEPETSQPVPQPLSARRLAPPPKPARKTSPSIPAAGETAAALPKAAAEPPKPIFARPGAPLGSALQPAARLPASTTQPLLPAQSQAPAPGPSASQQQPPPPQATPAAKPITTTQPLSARPFAGAVAPPAAEPAAPPPPVIPSRRMSATSPETPVARLPTPLPPVTPGRASALSEPSPPGASARTAAEILRRVADPTRPRPTGPIPSPYPPRPSSSPPSGSDRPVARSPSAPIDVRSPSAAPAGRSPSSPLDARAPSSPPGARSPSAPFDVRSPSGSPAEGRRLPDLASGSPAEGRRPPDLASGSPAEGRRPPDLASGAARPPSAPPAARTPYAPIDVRIARPPPAPALPTGLGPAVRPPVVTASANPPPLKVELSAEPALELDEPIAARPPAPSTPDEPSPSPPVSEPKTPAIMAMRIIVVGESSRVQLRSDVPPPFESTPPPPPEQLEPESPRREGIDAAEELTEDDVAPDSEDRPHAVESAGAPASEDPSRRPPPPPRRQGAAASELATQKEKAEAPVQHEKKETLDDAPRTRQRRPWWEELFGEDFIRATKRLNDRQIQQECSFIEESLGVAAGGVVLDLGCGAGQHAVELASRGYGVVGYDLSLFQLALAAEVAQEQDQRLNFLQGDMREMAFEEMFDGVYCWNTTFGYFEEEKNFAVAQRVFKALRPGGMFLLDVANRDFVVAQSPSQVWYEGEGCVCMDDMSVDFITSRLRVKRSVILDDGRTRECTYSIRLYSLHELGKLLHDVGFRVTEASGHPSMPGVFFGQSSPRIVILAQRP